MKKKLILWFYTTFGKTSSPEKIDWLLFSMVIFIITVLFVGLRILI